MQGPFPSDTRAAGRSPSGAAGIGVPTHDETGLSRRDLDPDPFRQLRIWLEEASRAGVPFPEAMALATADRTGRPSVRHVLMKGLDARGVLFFTNLSSRKARDLAENPHAAAVFLWRQLDRQVSLSGRVEPASREETEAYFRTRPRKAQLGAWASRQSEPVGSRTELEAAFRAADERFAGQDVPLPPHWGGFRIVPDAFEFWKGREHRLHDRFRYTRTADGWSLERLYP